MKTRFYSTSRKAAVSRIPEFQLIIVAITIFQKNRFAALIFTQQRNRLVLCVLKPLPFDHSINYEQIMLTFHSGCRYRPKQIVQIVDTANIKVLPSYEHVFFANSSIGEATRINEHSSKRSISVTEIASHNLVNVCTKSVSNWLSRLVLMVKTTQCCFQVFSRSSKEESFSRTSISASVPP
jgi:hypothetical protein